MSIDDGTKKTLRGLISYLAGRTGKDSEALAKRLTKAVEAGKVQRGCFTVADFNLLQAYINAQQKLPESEAQVDQLQDYQTAVQGLVEWSRRTFPDPDV